MKLSIVVVTWNSARDVEACLDSLHSQHRFEVIVVDNASTDGTRNKLKQYHDIDLILNSVNTGYARGNNQGFNKAQGEYVLILNPDTKAQPGSIDRLIAWLDANPDYAAAAPRLQNFDGSTQRSIRDFPTPGSVLWELTGCSRLFPMNRRIGRIRMAWFDYDRPGDAPQPMTSCLLVRRRLLRQFHGLDESFPIYYNDVDLSLRMSRAGWKTRYLPDARVFHRRGASTGQVKPKMIWEAHRSLFRFLRKHDRSGLFWLKSVLLLPMLELTALVRVICYRLSHRG